jgi:hypothetical protein
MDETVLMRLDAGKTHLEPHFMQSKSLPKPLGSLSPFGIFDHKSGCVVTMVSQLENRGNQSEIAATSLRVTSWGRTLTVERPVQCRPSASFA